MKVAFLQRKRVKSLMIMMIILFSFSSLHIENYFVYAQAPELVDNPVINTLPDLGWEVDDGFDAWEIDWWFDDLNDFDTLDGESVEEWGMCAYNILESWCYWELTRETQVFPTDIPSMDIVAGIEYSTELVVCSDMCTSHWWEATPLQVIDEITQCMTSGDMNCAEEADAFCRWAYDHLIASEEQWETIQTKKCEEWTAANQKELDALSDLREKFKEEYGVDPQILPEYAWWNNWWVNEEWRIPTSSVPQEAFFKYSKLFEPVDLPFKNAPAECCGVTMFTKKHLWKAIENEYYECTATCPYDGRILEYNQKFRQDNECHWYDDCLSAMQETCNVGEVYFPENYVESISWREVVFPGLLLFNEVAEDIVPIDASADRLRPDSSYDTGDQIADILSKTHSVASTVLSWQSWEWLKDIAWESWEWVLWDIADWVWEVWRYLGVATAILEWDAEGIIDAVVDLWVDILLENAWNIILEMFGSIGAEAYLNPFSLLWIPPPASTLLWIGTKIAVKRVAKKAKEAAIKRWDKNFERGQEFLCGPWFEFNKLSLREVEEMTGCAGVENCSDEIYLWCWWTDLAHESQLIESCHECWVKTLDASGNEVIPGERAKDKFIDFTYQCTWTLCWEEPGTTISAKKIDTMFACEDSCDDDSWECYQACIEDSAIRYCLGMSSDYTVSEHCSAFGEDDFTCSSACGVAPGTEISRGYLEDEYHCTDTWSCQYYATIECINADHAKNPEKAKEVEESVPYCFAEFNDPVVGRSTWTCSNSCVKAGETIRVSSLDCNQSSDSACQPKANAWCGWDDLSYLSSCDAEYEWWWEFMCAWGCFKAPDTAVSVDYLEKNYSCSWYWCKNHAQERCMETIAPPVCQATHHNNWALPDYYTCEEGCEKPEWLKLMKWSLWKELGCDESSVEDCQEKAVEFCEWQHPFVQIDDRTRLEIGRETGSHYVGLVSEYADITKSVLTTIPGMQWPVIDGIIVWLTTIEDINSRMNILEWVYGQIQQLVTLNLTDFDSVMWALYIINNYESTLEQLKRLTAPIQLQDTSLDGTCWYWSLTTEDWTAYLYWKHEDAYFKISTFLSWEISKLIKSDNDKDNVNDWVIPYGGSCPDLDTIKNQLAQENAINNWIIEHWSAWNEDDYQSGIWLYEVVQIPCETKNDLLTMLCLDTLPDSIEKKEKDDGIHLIPVGLAEDDLVCQDPVWRDCNPFVSWDEFYVHIYEPVLSHVEEVEYISCYDWIQNGDETWIDCWWSCWCCDWVTWSCEQSSWVDCSNIRSELNCWQANWCTWIPNIDPIDNYDDWYCSSQCDDLEKTLCAWESGCTWMCWG